LLSEPLGCDQFELTRSRVDASPEHPRPRFDGGTGVRTVRALGFDVVRLYSHFWEELHSSTMERGPKRESRVQRRDGVENYLRSDVHTEFVKRTTRNRHLGMSGPVVGCGPVSSKR
jgi:hypothetical protein